MLQLTLHQCCWYFSQFFVVLLCVLFLESKILDFLFMFFSRVFCDGPMQSFELFYFYLVFFFFLVIIVWGKTLFGLVAMHFFLCCGRMGYFWFWNLFVLSFCCCLFLKLICFQSFNIVYFYCFCFFFSSTLCVFNTFVWIGNECLWEIKKS